MKILIAEDDTSIAEAYKDALETRNHEIILTENGEECLKKYQTESLTMQQSGYSAEQQNRKNCGSYGRHKSNATVPFDVVILDYKMPKKDGLQVAKEIFELNPKQRVIFASAYVQDTLVDSVKHLKRVVELMQKPFGLQQLIDTVEDKEAYEALNNLIVSIRNINDLNLTNEEIQKLFQYVRRIQKYRTY
jgi:DNA-binding NtrC family response regulator